MPALVALRRHYPKAHIAWLVEEVAAEMLQRHVALDEVILWPRRQFQKDIKALHWFNAARAFRDVLARVRGRRFDLVLDFQGLLKSALWVFLAKGTRKVGFGPGMDHSEGSHLVLNERIAAVSMEVHALERGMMLLEKLEIPRGPVEYEFPHNHEAAAAVDEFLSMLHFTH